MTKLAFLNNEWFWPTTIISIIIWLIFIWKEWSRYPKTKFFANILIAFIAILALACIALKPLRPTEGKSFKAVIVTNDYKEKQLDSLKKAYPNLMIIPYSDGESIFENSDIPEHVFLIGNGIKSYDLWQLDSINTTYLGGNLPRGIIKLNYNTENHVGKNIKIKGLYQDAIKGSKLLLEKPGGQALDSIFLSSAKAQDFQLSTNIKISGKLVYNIVEKDSLNNIITKYPLPINATEENRLSILIINDFPTFESKYLKNYLATKGHKVIVRSQLTKDRYKYEYFNSKNRPTINFNRKNIEIFDLIIIDAASLNKLSRRQRYAIEQSVRKDGLGVFIQPDNSFFNSNSRLVPFAFKKNKNTTATLKNWPRTKINTYPYNFRQDFALQAIQLANTKILSTYKRLEIGRIGTTTTQNTYQLLLNGHQEVYQDIWSKIVENTSKKKIKTVEWAKNSLFSFENEPMHFKVRTQVEKPKISTDEEMHIPLQRNLDIASIWNGKTYPKKSWLETTYNSTRF